MLHHPHLFATALQDANVDPLIRMQVMGHASGNDKPMGRPLAMTAHYTHTRDDTLRSQIEAALRARPAVSVIRARLARLPGKTAAV